MKEQIKKEIIAEINDISGAHDADERAERMYRAWKEKDDE